MHKAKDCKKEQAIKSKSMEKNYYQTKRTYITKDKSAQDQEKDRTKKVKSAVANLTIPVEEDHLDNNV